jgi:HPt (histidine-containing phosphotransfer) domain-containing protein
MDMTETTFVYLDTSLALEQIGDEDAMNGMLGMLNESLTNSIPQITQLLEAGQVEKANRLLHSIKGFIPIFCRKELCQHVVAVELMSKDSQSTTVKDAYAALRPQLEHLLTDVKAHLKSLPK